MDMQANFQFLTPFGIIVFFGFGDRGFAGFARKPLTLFLLFVIPNEMRNLFYKG